MVWGCAKGGKDDAVQLFLMRGYTAFRSHLGKSRARIHILGVSEDWEELAA